MRFHKKNVHVFPLSVVSFPLCVARVHSWRFGRGSKLAISCLRCHSSLISSVGEGQTAIEQGEIVDAGQAPIVQGSFGHTMEVYTRVQIIWLLLVLVLWINTQPSGMMPLSTTWVALGPWNFKQYWCHEEWNWVVIPSVKWMPVALLCYTQAVNIVIIILLCTQLVMMYGVTIVFQRNSFILFTLTSQRCRVLRQAYGVVAEKSLWRRSSELKEEPLTTI